jgi:predicted nucleotidyltransferase
VHRIADALEPYLRILIEQFAPEQIILFGSYAYSKPNADSDIDLLVIKPLTQPGWKEALRIQRAWRPLRLKPNRLNIELVVESPQRHQERLARKGAFYREINERGVSLL